MKVIINTRPTLNRKTGIGYCIENIIDQLSKKDLELVLSHNPKGAKTSLNIKKISDQMKKTMGQLYPSTLAAFSYNLLLSPYIRSFNNKSNKKEYFDIYHEMSHVVLQRIFDKADVKYFIADIHDLSPFIYPQYHLKSLVDDVKKTLPQLLSADLFITKTDFIKTEFANHFDIPIDKIEVVPNAPSYPYQHLNLTSNEKRSILQNSHLDINERPFILYTGTIEPRKNLQVLIQAFSRFPYNKEFDLICAGGLGWRYDEIIALPEKLGMSDNIKFPGYLTCDEFEMLYNCADFFVYPSLYEGFGMPNIEAMQCGLPVITSNSSCLPEVAGDAALFFDPLEPDELVEKMTLLVESTALKNNLRAKGLVRSSLYTWQSTGDKLYSIYSTLCSQ